MADVVTRPVLSICIPAYDRPRLIEISLQALTSISVDIQNALEVVITDDSSNDGVERVVHAELACWRGAAKYQRNPRRLGMAGNWNAAVRAATGTAIAIVHDDDYILPAALPNVVEYLADRPAPVTAFGVQLVNGAGGQKRTERVHRAKQLRPTDAVRRLLSRSSFIRFPGVVVLGEAYVRAGLFDETLGEAADVDMWLRLCGEYGLLMHPEVFAAYRVHEGALTTGMWRRGTLQTLELIAQRVPMHLVSPEERNELLGMFFSQFLLAGATRRLRNHDHAAALRILDLFRDDLVRLKPIPISRRLARHFLAATAEVQSWFELRRGVA